MANTLQLNYYPFGMNITALSSAAPMGMPNRFKLSGNEEQTDFDWNVYDFNARGYDVVLGRFMQVDILADVDHSISINPYHYVANNPILNIDPDGRDWFVNDGDGSMVYLQGMSEFNEDAVREVYGDDFYESLGSGSYSNFGSDDMFDTEDFSFSGFLNSELSGYYSMSASSSEEFMKSRGYSIAIEQQISEFDVEMWEFDQGFKPSIQQAGSIDVVNEKLTYARPEDYGIVGKKRVDTSASNHWIKVKKTNYRQITNSWKSDYKRTVKVKNQFSAMEGAKLGSDIFNLIFESKILPKLFK